ncbi:cytochrome c biogenesis protein ResB, partial [Aeromicrobium sp.]|uniref:cytochrome c biogenesis protein ResB n=1 Tax=Aeromicrobium sp. TaxID=1871063 RepID=UPI0019B046C1
MSAVNELGRREFTRWFWRQLTSMRTALFLLMLLAIAAVPGSIVPQRSVDARAVETYFLDHPTTAPTLDKLGLFSVYSSPWFSAIYLLLMVSLIGCIVPRSFVYYRALRARPPGAPRNFSRLPAHTTFTTEASVDEVLEAGRKALGRARIDVVDGDDGARELNAEKGFLREAGNLVFHISVVVVLIGVAVGTFFGYRGTAIVTEGNGFSNTLTQYDEFGSGTLYNADDLPPFSMTLDDFTAKFQLSGPQRGAPRLFRAQGAYTPEPGAAPRPYDITVNHPLAIGSTSVYLVGQGYAPIIKVTDPKGNVVFDDAVPFLPVDPTYTSNGVIKVPDAEPEQLGFQGFFLPTAVKGAGGVSVSTFPAAANPLIGLFVWHGDLGLDAGVPQSVYSLDKSKMKQYLQPNGSGKGFRISLSPGQETDLPDGGTVEYVSTKQFVRFQISSSPLVEVPLIGISAGVLGLIASLFVRPRRTWIRARREGSRTMVEVAALDRVPRDDLPAELEDLLGRLRAQ